MRILDSIGGPLAAQLKDIINGRKGRELRSVTKAIERPNDLLEFVIRSRDLCFGAIALIQLSPVILAVSLAVYITSGRPIFFRQKRLGRGGNLFTMYKFRTMRTDAEEVLRSDLELYRRYVENDYKLVAEEDTRITRLGRFLRSSTLDEIPQFLNVVRGDMSLIGPRPIVPAEIERYDGDADEFLSVKPGITGLWQVTGRSSIPYPERKYIDLVYTRNRSVYLDLKILLKTVKVVFIGTGAH